MLNGRKILLGVTGGIAAYKSANIIRLLVKEGAEVKVIMTSHAKEFITPLTLATLSKNPILVDFFDPEDGRWNSHIDLGLWADMYLIAPATANTIAKMAAGVADNLLLTSYLSARCPVFIAPAMDVDMLNHQATQNNIRTLISYGNTIIEPGTGELASGLTGKGRMAEPETIVEAVKTFFSWKKPESILKNKRIFINAGPTVEHIDPVRYISNHSSGRMGIAIADAASEMGAEVTLVLGPVNLKPENKNIRVVNVITADEMLNASLEAFNNCEIGILAAAVADFTPKFSAQSKIKRTSGNPLLLELIPTKDIAATLGEQKKENQFLCGFALETDNELDNAVGKLKRKNLDLIVLNSLKETGAGFGYETNKITTIDKNNNIDKFELKTKREVAIDILNKIASLIQ